MLAARRLYFLVLAARKRNLTTSRARKKKKQTKFNCSHARKDHSIPLEKAIKHCRHNIYIKIIFVIANQREMITSIIILYKVPIQKQLSLVINLKNFTNTKTLTVASKHGNTKKSPRNTIH